MIKVYLWRVVLVGEMESEKDSCAALGRRTDNSLYFSAKFGVNCVDFKLFGYKLIRVFECLRLPPKA